MLTIGYSIMVEINIKGSMNFIAPVGQVLSQQHLFDSLLPEIEVE
jgi:hypothetical protein